MLHSPVVTTGSEAGAKWATQKDLSLPFFFLQACSFNSGSQMLWSLITPCSWKHRMSELERKNLIINNHCQHLLNTYSVPGLVPGSFPGITLFTLPNNSRRQIPSLSLFYREENRGFREITGHLPNHTEWYTVAKNTSWHYEKRVPLLHTASCIRLLGNSQCTSTY